MDPHRLAEERSIALHLAVAERLRRDPRLIERARSRVDRWLATQEVHPTYARAWAELLERPLEELCSAIVDRGEKARALRQCSPFAGVLDAPTRWKIWREVTQR